MCNNTLAISLANSNGGVVKVPHSTTFDAEKVKQQLGVSVSQWDAFNYEMKQLTNRRVTQAEAANYLNLVFNDVKDDGLILFNTAKREKDAVPNAKAMNQVMNMLNGQGRGADLASAKDTAYGLLNAMTEFVDHERRAMSQDHRLDSAWFGAGAKLKDKSLDEALRLIA